MKKILSIALVVILAVGMLAGCGKKDTTIKIGILGCHTGDAAQYGLAVLNGAQLYIDKVNADGGINGKQIEPIIYDDKGDTTEAVNAFTRMVDNDKITALLGSVLTDPTLAVVREAYPIGMPMITASATAAEVTYDNGTLYSNVFRTCFIDPFQGEKMAQYASEVLGATTAAVIYQTGNNYAEGLKDAFCREGRIARHNHCLRRRVFKGRQSFPEPAHKHQLQGRRRRHLLPQLLRGRLADRHAGAPGRA